MKFSIMDFYGVITSVLRGKQSDIYKNLNIFIVCEWRENDES